MKEIQARYDAKRKEAEVLDNESNHGDPMIKKVTPCAKPPDKKRRNLARPEIYIFETDNVDVAKYTNKHGIIETIDTDLTCQMCLIGFKQKSHFLYHCKYADCLSICQWKYQDTDHEHDWVNISFAKFEDAKKYARVKMDAELLYIPITNLCTTNISDSNESSDKNIIYNCYLRRKHKSSKDIDCKAQLRIRPSRRYVDENILVPVYELIGCAYHTHELEYRYE